MNIDEIDRKWINIGAVVAILICLIITVAVWNIWAHPAPNDEVIMNTTIEENVTPTPTPVPTQAENATVEELIAIAEILRPTEETIQEENCTTTIGGVDTYTTYEPETDEECIMRVDGETIQITDEDIHNALMTCAIEDMTFDEFKRHVRDSGIDT